MDEADGTAKAAEQRRRGVTAEQPPRAARALPQSPHHGCEE